jgi:holliday junction DNA helicase RuvA
VYMAAVARASGVGPKLAARIVAELKNKPLGDGSIVSFQPNLASAQPIKASASGEAVAALMGLGIPEPQARRVVEAAAVRLGEEAEPPALIKAALQEIGR